MANQSSMVYHKIFGMVVRNTLEIFVENSVEYKMKIISVKLELKTLKRCSWQILGEFYIVLLIHSVIRLLNILIFVL